MVMLACCTATQCCIDVWCLLLLLEVGAAPKSVVFRAARNFGDYEVPPISWSVGYVFLWVFS